uniref:Uncharacterized protein n=1 Tax=Rhizophora mucronata TaxID=61149 RepID=A0A2P2QCC5_RHIMU
MTTLSFCVRTRVFSCWAFTWWVFGFYLLLHLRSPWVTLEIMQK